MIARTIAELEIVPYRMCVSMVTGTFMHVPHSHVALTTKHSKYSYCMRYD